MKKILLVAVLVVLASAIPSALSVQPLPDPLPPEQWYPTHPSESLPPIPLEGRIPIMKEQERTLEIGQPFYLVYYWQFIPSSVGYRETGEVVDPITDSLQGKTDVANVIFVVTMDGETLRPTSTFTATCRWLRTTGQDPDDLSAVVIIPTSTLHIYYIEFPEGLADERTYSIILHIEYPQRSESIDVPTTLVVEPS